MTSTFHVAYFKEDMFGRSIYPPSLTVLAFVCEKLGRAGGGGGLHPGPRGQIKARSRWDQLIQSSTMSETSSSRHCRSQATILCQRREITSPHPLLPPHSHWKKVEQRSKAKQQKKTVGGRIFLAFSSNLTDILC